MLGKTHPGDVQLRSEGLRLVPQRRDLPLEPLLRRQVGGPNARRGLGALLQRCLYMQVL